jgi:hypothetical protein
MAAAMARRVEREWLDELPAADPRARRSRQDLVRVNGLMGNAGLVARELRHAFPHGPESLAEIGAGDGAFALRLVKRLPPARSAATLVLLDRQPCMAPATQGALRARGWSPDAVNADVFDWLRDERTPRFDAIVANLFLHHFEADRLRELLALAARRASLFIACEPRRGAMPLLASRLLGFIGCNDVTRHDAVASVRAGFSGAELTALWPADRSCVLEEDARGAFSHLFVARDECPTTR